MTEYDYPIETRLVVNGVEVPADPADLENGVPTWMDGLSFTWGRSSTVDQPDVGACTFTFRQQLTGTVRPMLDVIQVDATVEIWSDVTIPADPGQPAHVVPLLVWSGTVTSVNGQAAGDNGVLITVTAAGTGASLADETIGDDPWPVQTVQTRVNRILQLAKTDTTPITVAPRVAGTKLTYRDVDAQSVLDLLQDVAQSVGGVLWVATNADSGTYLWLEDPSERASVRQFIIDAATRIITITPTAGDSAIISADDLLRDPIQWTQDKAQVINSVDVSWQRQDVGDDGIPAPVTKTITVTQPGTKIVRKLSVETELISQLDGTALASRLLARTSATNGWLASGLSIDTRLFQRDIPDLDYQQRLTTVVYLLDGTLRAGRSLTLIGLPEWTPGGQQTSVYVEGGTYSLTNGKWVLDLDISATTGLGKSATFADFAGTGSKISDFEPSITGQDAAGVSGPYGLALGMGGGLFGDQPFGP